MNTDMAIRYTGPVATDLVPLTLDTGPDDGKPRIGAHNGRSISLDVIRESLRGGPLSRDEIRKAVHRYGNTFDKTMAVTDALFEGLETVGSTRGPGPRAYGGSGTPKVQSGGKPLSPDHVGRSQSTHRERSPRDKLSAHSASTMRLARYTDGQELKLALEKGYQESPSIAVVNSMTDNPIVPTGFRKTTASDRAFDFPVVFHYRRNAFKPGIRGTKIDIAVPTDSFSPTTPLIVGELSRGKSYQDILVGWKTKAGAASPVNIHVGVDKNGRPFLKSPVQVRSEIKAEELAMKDLGLRRAPSDVDTAYVPSDGRFGKSFDRFRRERLPEELFGRGYGELKPLRKIGLGAIDFVEFPREALKTLPSDFTKRLDAAGVRYRLFDMIRPEDRPMALKSEVFIANPIVRGQSAIPEMFPEAFREDAKGGHVTKGGNAPDLTGMSNFLATDKVPDTLFGIPIVSRREDYTEADLRFFKDHPEAGGYYDMGEETPEDGSAEGAPVQADKGGLSDGALYEIEQREAVAAAYASAYAEGGESTVVPTGRTVEELVYDPSARKPGDEGYEDPKAVIAGLPKSTYERGGRYYRKVQETADRLALTTKAETDALERIQSDFRTAKGRDMESDVAAIRAKLAAGTIGRDEARELALTLRKARDVKAAKDAASAYWHERGTTDGRHPMAVAASDWRRFYVDTGKLGVLATKHGLQAVADAVNMAPEGERYDIMNRAIATRFGLEEVTEDSDIMSRNPELDIPGNYSILSRGRRAAAKRVAMKVASGADGIRNESRVRAARDYLNRLDVRSVDENVYEGLRSGVPFEVKTGTKKVRTGRYRVRQADMDGGRTLDDLDSFITQADGKGGDAYADRAIAAMNDVVPFTKVHEGFRANAYKDSQGVWTVGYGQTTLNGRPVREGDTISEPDAVKFLTHRIRENAYHLYKQHPWMKKLSQNALAAAYDLAYNLGDGILKDAKGLSPRLNRRIRNGEDPETVFWDEYGTYLGGKDATPETRKGLENRRNDAKKKWKVN